MCASGADGAGVRASSYHQLGTGPNEPSSLRLGDFAERVTAEQIARIT
jgi:hypothetical protein